MNDLLKLAIEGHGGARRWEQVSRFRAAASITGAIWVLKGKPGLLDGLPRRRPAARVAPFVAAGRVMALRSVPVSGQLFRRAFARLRRRV